jgi:hypothetical protein
MAPKILGAEVTKLVPKNFGNLLIKEIILYFPQVTLVHILRYVYR